MSHTERTRHRSPQHSRLIITLAASAGLALLASGCSAAASPSLPHDDVSAPDMRRLAVSTPGSVTVLDGGALATGALPIIGSAETDEFTRLNAVGDGTHLLVSTARGFEVFDTASAKFTGLTFPALSAGHVVRHEGTTVLFDDDSGRTTILDSGALRAKPTTLPATTEFTAAEAHHGVSIVLTDGTLLTTVGDAESRTGAAAHEPHGDHWHELTASTECPGIHGEGAAAHEAVVFGCQDGALMYRDGEFTKLPSPEATGRIGSVFASDDSPIAVTDYQPDPDAEGVLRSALALIDTTAGTLRVLELPEEIRYTFRDVARGPDGLAYILSTDGAIHVLDPVSGKFRDAYQVIDAWSGPDGWQDPHPTLVVDGGHAYVTEPATRSVHAVDLETGKTLASTQLDAVPSEIAVALG